MGKQAGSGAEVDGNKTGDRTRKEGIILGEMEKRERERERESGADNCVERTRWMMAERTGRIWKAIDMLMRRPLCSPILHYILGYAEQISRPVIHSIPDSTSRKETPRKGPKSSQVPT